MMNNQPRVAVRRLWDRDGFGVWMGQTRGDKYVWAKPVVFEMKEEDSSWMLPDPTFTIPAHQMKEFFTQLSEQLSMQGEPSINPHKVVEAKDENLKDLRKIIDQLFESVGRMP